MTAAELALDLDCRIGQVALVLGGLPADEDSGPVAHPRRQRVKYPPYALLGASAFSLTAQLAVAKSGLSGWIVSAAPSLAFIGITKLVLSLKPVTCELTP